MRFSLILFFLLFIYYKAYPQKMEGYQIINVTDLRQLEKKEEVIEEIVDQPSGASIRFLASGKIILIPTIGTKGLLIVDRKSLKEILKNGIPIPDSTEIPEKVFQELLHNIPDNKQIFLSLLEDGLQVSIELDNDSVDYYKKIDSAIKKYGYLNFYKNLYTPFTVFIGEKLRLMYKLDWQLKTRYDVNSYLSPVLVSGKNETILPNYKLADYLLEKKSFTMERFMDGVNWWVRAYEVEKK